MSNYPFLFFQEEKPKKPLVSTTIQRFFWCEISPKCEISFGTVTRLFLGENLGKIRQKSKGFGLGSADLEGLLLQVAR